MVTSRFASLHNSIETLNRAKSKDLPQFTLVHPESGAPYSMATTVVVGKQTSSYASAQQWLREVVTPEVRRITGNQALTASLPSEAQWEVFRKKGESREPVRWEMTSTMRFPSGGDFPGMLVCRAGDQQRVTDVSARGVHDLALRIMLQEDPSLIPVQSWSCAI